MPLLSCAHYTLERLLLEQKLFKAAMHVGGRAVSLSIPSNP